MDLDPRLKSLSRQTGIAKRTAKDVESYEKELQQLTDKLNKMISDGKDEYDIKHQKLAVDETVAVIPDCKTRKERAIADLRTMLADYSDLGATEAYVAAKDLLAQIGEEA